MSFFGTGTGGQGNGLFGNTTAGNVPSTPNLFGNTGSGGTSGLFGNTAAKPAANSAFATNTPAVGTAGGLANAPPLGTTITPSTGLFGANTAGSAGTSATSTGTGSNLFSGFGTSNSTTPGLFGSSSTTTTSAPPIPSPSFGNTANATAKPGLFTMPSLGGTAPAATPSAPAPPLFGSTVKPAEAASATGQKKASVEEADSTAPTNVANPPAPGPFSAGLFGKKPDAPAASSTPAPAAGVPNLFGKPADSSKPPAPATGGFNLFGAPKEQEKKDGAAAPSPFTLGTNSADKARETSTSGNAPAPGVSGAGALPTANIAVAPPSTLKGKTIEDIVNKWSNDLETQVRDFSKFAGEVSVWDRALIENGNNLAALYGHVLAAEREQNEIDQSLDHIEQQQADLAATLDAYEKSMQEVLGGQGGSLRALDTGPADTERDKNYMLATDLHTHLDDLSTSLSQMIDSVNGLSLQPDDSSKKTSGDDPMVQISQILSSHLESLQWIDGAAREVEGKVSEVEKRVKESGVGGSSYSGGQRSRGFGLR